VKAAFHHRGSLGVVSAFESIGKHRIAQPAR